MQILTRMNVGFRARHMRYLLLHTSYPDALTMIASKNSAPMCQTCRTFITNVIYGRPSRNIQVKEQIYSQTRAMSTRSVDLLAQASEDVMRVAKSLNPISAMPLSSRFLNASHSQDLKRFLQEVGTDPREGRYWLKMFQRSTGPLHPFAVVQVDEEVIRDKHMLDALSSSLAYLHRNDMKLVVLHGQSLNEGLMSSEESQNQRQQVLIDNMLLVSMLESHGVLARPLLAGSRIIQVEPYASGCSGSVTNVNLDAVKWAMQSHHIPVIQAIGETSSGQLLSVDNAEATSEIAKSMQPLKVLFVNTVGGINDEMGEVIANINLPADLEHANSKPWCSSDIHKKIRFIAELLDSLPSQSSVVVTAATKLIAELFTHHGSGTLFKNTEPILQYNHLDNIEKERLQALINRSFGKDLEPDYFDNLPEKFRTLYLSEGYNAAAVITNEHGLDVPYLDKFAVSMVKQGEGTGEMLWDCIRRDFKQLFWRSKVTNRINPWYFKRSEGSWSNGEWTVFWYGVSDHQVSSKLVEYALQLPNTFGNNGNGLDNTLVE